MTNGTFKKHYKNIHKQAYNYGIRKSKQIMLKRTKKFFNDIENLKVLEENKNENVRHTQEKNS